MNSKKNDKNINVNGQYFTKNPILQQKIYEFIHNNNQSIIEILEPCVGRGDLVKYIRDIQCNQNNKDNQDTNKTKYIFDMYELDDKIEFIIDKNEIKFGDFLLAKINKKYKTIIGNQPYIQRKKNINTYIAFIEKCYELLEDNGELIFIVPSDFFKLTSSKNILNKMTNNGHFTHIFHPHNEKLFENAAIDVLIFRYQHGEFENKITVYNDENTLLQNSNGIITFINISNTNDINHNQTFSQLFDIYVGLVSGKDKIFKNNTFGNINVLCDEGLIQKWIYLNEFPKEEREQDRDLINYLNSHKQELISRKIRKFTDKNWFQLGAPRNITIMEQLNTTKEKCIYVRTITRKNKIAFIGECGYFGGGLLMLKPKNNNINLENIINYLNSDEFKKNFMYSGRFKIGHNQLSNTLFIA